MPRKKIPNLKLQTVANGDFELSSEVSERGTLVCFYRGLHCPICATYLKELEKLTPQFQERGMKTIAVSTDDEGRANEMATSINAKNLRVGETGRCSFCVNFPCNFRGDFAQRMHAKGIIFRF